jgi:hypothetical protein
MNVRGSVQQVLDGRLLFDSCQSHHELAAPFSSFTRRQGGTSKSCNIHGLGSAIGDAVSTFSAPGYIAFAGTQAQ